MPQSGPASMTYRSRLRLVLESIEGVVLLGALVSSWPLSKGWLNHWGSHVQEREREWPGDRFVSPNHQTYTRAIGIRAPAEAVWPWIVQFGLGRAGFYSYELLERMVGIPVVNVESIEPTLQSLAVGDEIRLHPKAPGIPVGDLHRGRYVCFGALHSSSSSSATSEPARSWSIYIEPVGAGECRLLLRGCIEPLTNATWLKRLAFALEGPIDFVMEQRMLRTVKRLAEMGLG